MCPCANAATTSLTANRRRLLVTAGAAVVAVPLSEFLTGIWSVLLPILPLATAGYLAVTVSRRGGHTGLSDVGDASLRLLVYLAATVGVLAGLFVDGALFERWWVVLAPALVLLWLRAAPQPVTGPLADVFD